METTAPITTCFIFDTPRPLSPCGIRGYTRRGIDLVRGALVAKQMSTIKASIDHFDLLRSRIFDFDRRQATGSCLMIFGTMDNTVARGRSNRERINGGRVW